MKKTQSGRSMIEMLGVLAIIGVLSVGGLMGYQRAMRNNRVNDAMEYFRHARVAYEEGRTSGVIGAANMTCVTLLQGDNMPTGMASCRCQNGSCFVALNTEETIKEFATRIDPTLVGGIEDDINHGVAASNIILRVDEDGSWHH